MAFDSFDKIQVDFDSSDLAGMEGLLEGNNEDFDKLLAKDPDDRYQTALGLKLDLESLGELERLRQTLRECAERQQAILARDDATAALKAEIRELSAGLAAKQQETKRAREKSAYLQRIAAEQASELRQSLQAAQTENAQLR